MNKKVRLNFDIDNMEHERLKVLANEYGVTVSQYCRLALSCPIIVVREGGEQNSKDSSQ